MKGLVYGCSVCKEEGVKGEILYVDDCFSEVDPSSYDTGTWMCEPCIETAQEPVEFVKVYAYHYQIGEEIFDVDIEHVNSFMMKLQDAGWDSVSNLGNKVCVHCGKFPDKRELCRYEGGDIFCIDCGVDCSRSNMYEGGCHCNVCTGKHE